MLEVILNFTTLMQMWSWSWVGSTNVVCLLITSLMQLSLRRDEKLLTFWEWFRCDITCHFLLSDFMARYLKLHLAVHVKQAFRGICATHSSRHLGTVCSVFVIYLATTVVVIIRIIIMVKGKNKVYRVAPHICHLCGTVCNTAIIQLMPQLKPAHTLWPAVIQLHVALVCHFIGIILRHLMIMLFRTMFIVLSSLQGHLLRHISGRISSGIAISTLLQQNKNWYHSAHY